MTIQYNNKLTQVLKKRMQVYSHYISVRKLLMERVFVKLG